MAGPLALIVSLVVTATMAVAWGGTATSATSATSAPTASAKGSVAHNGLGKLSSRVRGTTGNDRSVTGTFVPLSFSKRNGKVFVRGLVQGVVHNKNGTTSTFGVMRKMRVKRINGAPATTAARASAAAAECDVLNLVLGPLDLDLLGLQVHLNRVVLNIVAVSGAGNLLGNLLCAVVGLLDGGLSGVLGRLVRLLNRILGRLGLGL
ncbi:hypothetical protein [Nocardioides sp.]|uniref:hypothetical protein n=1 Tax=Nocardioides sp. TaxID=35761 RepID=UPI002ED3052C